MSMTPTEITTALARLAELDAKATKGPWRRVGGATPRYTSITSPNGGYIVACMSDGEYGVSSPPMDTQDANARLIAEARNALPLLLALAREALAGREYDDLRREADWMWLTFDVPTVEMNRQRGDAWAAYARARAAADAEAAKLGRTP